MFIFGFLCADLPVITILMQLLLRSSGMTDQACQVTDLISTLMTSCEFDFDFTQMGCFN